MLSEGLRRVEVAHRGARCVDPADEPEQAHGVEAAAVETADDAEALCLKRLLHPIHVAREDGQLREAARGEEERVLTLALRQR